MRGFLFGVLATLAAVGGLAAYLWYQAPEYLPEGLRERNPRSPDYQPVIYRWKDDQGRTQITDKPPSDRAYESIRVDPKTNVVPKLEPHESDVRDD